MTTKKKVTKLTTFAASLVTNIFFHSPWQLKWLQRGALAKKAVSSSPRLVDFAIGLVSSVLKTFEKLFTIRLLAISLSNQWKRTSARTKQLLKKINYPEATFPEINS